MSNTYYEAIDRMEKSGVDPDYILGWASGYLHNPAREVQRVSAAYEAGHAHGLEKNAAAFETWVRK